MIALRYLASNSHQLSVADGFNISQSVVSKIVNQVVNLWSEHISEFVSFPTDQQELKRMKQGFYHLNNANFPCVVGAIDGTHVRCSPHEENESDYVNRKGFYSINVQAVCDSEGKYTNVVARFCGSTHDSFVLKHSNLWTAFEEQHVPVGNIILGDSGYPCRPWLLTKFPNPVNNAQKSFNAAHSRTRVIIEQSFGRLKRQWNILHEGIRMPIEMVPKIIGVCFMLRNLAIEFGSQNELDEQLVDDLLDDMNEVYCGNLTTDSAFRNHYAVQYFS